MNWRLPLPASATRAFISELVRKMESHHHSKSASAWICRIAPTFPLFATTVASTMWSRGTFRMPLAVTAALGDEDIEDLLHSDLIGADFSLCKKSGSASGYCSSAVTLGCTRPFFGKGWGGFFSP